LEEFYDAAWYIKKVRDAQNRIDLCDADTLAHQVQKRRKVNGRLSRFELMRCIYKVFPETSGDFEQARKVALQTDYLLSETGLYKGKHNPKLNWDVSAEDLVYVEDHWNNDFDYEQFPAAIIEDLEKDCNMNVDGLVTRKEMNKCMRQMYREQKESDPQNAKAYLCIMRNNRSMIARGFNQADIDRNGLDKYEFIAAVDHFVHIDRKFGQTRRQEDCMQYYVQPQESADPTTNK
jgi:hypothetical protein